MASETNFEIRPNSGFNTRSRLWVFALLAVTCLSIAIRFALLGYWLILPFAILDVVAVGLILYLLMRSNAYVEKIRIRPDTLVIRHIEKRNRHSWTFALAWVQVVLESPRHRWYPHRLLLGSKGEWVEIGRCLTDPERQSLAIAIKTRIAELNGPQVV